MVSFWKTVIDVGGIKLRELGALGTALGIIWVLGIWMWLDFMTGAFAENMPQAATYYTIFLLGWIVVGLAVYLWRDPHGVRSAGVEGVDIPSGSEGDAD